MHDLAKPALKAAKICFKNSPILFLKNTMNSAHALQKKSENLFFQNISALCKLIIV